MDKETKQLLDSLSREVAESLIEPGEVTAKMVADELGWNVEKTRKFLEREEKAGRMTTRLAIADGTRVRTWRRPKK
jgi:hypothetical protein